MSKCSFEIYTARWRIEDFHKAWKTGAGVERLRMTEPDNIERTASILAFVAVRLLQLKETLSISYYLKRKGLIDKEISYEKTKCDAVFIPSAGS